MRSGVLFLPVEELSADPDAGLEGDGALRPETSSMQLTSAGLAKMSPFNVVVDRWDRVVSIGPKLAEMLGDARILGDLFDDHFVSNGPEGPTLQAVRSLGECSSVIVSRALPELRFRSQIVVGAVEVDDVVLHMVPLETPTTRPTKGSAADSHAFEGDGFATAPVAVAASQSQKLESLGLLAGGIAHDFNNQLAIVASALELLKLQDPASRVLVERISDAANRSAALVRQLLDLSGPAGSEPSPIEVAPLMELLGEVLTSTLGPDIQLVLVGGSDLQVFANQDLLVSALLNLVVNGRDAMPNGGVVSLNCYLVDNLRIDDLALDAHMTYCAFEVSDEGVGIRPELLAQVFEPFFTTKGSGEGSGLGLSSVHDFATSSGGTIVATKSDDGGTTMSLVLPTHSGIDRHNGNVDDGSGQGVVLGPQPERSGPCGLDLVTDNAAVSIAGKQVLVIEDEVDLALTFEALLSELGADPLVVYSLEAARDLLRDSKFYRPEFVLSDYYLADGSGEQVLALFGEVRPDTKVVLMSGNIDLRRSMTQEATEHLVKPFSAQELLAALGPRQQGSTTSN